MRPIIKKWTWILFIFMAVVPITGKAQQIANGSFDSLCVCAIDRVWQWVTSDSYYISQDTAPPFLPNSFYDNSSSNIHFAMNTVQLNYDADDSLGYINSVKILTRPDLVFPNGDVFKGFIFNGEHFYTNANGYIDLKRCGTPFAFRPDSLSVWYKFEDTLSTSNESGKIKVLLKKFNTINNSIDTIGFAESISGLSSASQWTRFSIPIHYISSSIPDSVVVVFYSSSGNGRLTTLWLDDIQFTYTLSGTDEPERETMLSVFPNPANGFIFIQPRFEKPIRYEITDVSGRRVQRGFMENSIDIKSLDCGLYFLQVHTEEHQVISCKFIRQ
jgi:hypothetical protein